MGYISHNKAAPAGGSHDQSHGRETCFDVWVQILGHEGAKKKKLFAERLSANNLALSRS